MKQRDLLPSKGHTVMGENFGYMYIYIYSIQYTVYIYIYMFLNQSLEEVFEPFQYRRLQIMGGHNMMLFAYIQINVDMHLCSYHISYVSCVYQIHDILPPLHWISTQLCK